MTSCDLKSCYDRVAHTPAMLALLGFGVPQEPLLSLFHSIQNMKYKTRTTYGDSTKTFGGIEAGYSAKPQGFGQGNGMASQGWSGMSSRMFEVMHKRGKVTQFYTPISINSLELSGLSYVDDADMFADAEGLNSPETTLHKMQETVDCWQGVANSTGGAIKTSKSWWFLLHYDWDNKGNWSYGNLDNLSATTLTSINHNQQREPLQYLPSDQGKKMLGVFLTPNGSNKLQISKMTEKISQTVEYVRTGHLQPHEAWTALTTMILKSVEYPLPVLTLTEAECKQIMWKILKVYLPKSHINRYITRDVLFGDIGSQGLGIKNIFLTQGISHITNLIEHTWKDTISGHLMRASLEQLRLEIGSNIPILQSDYVDYEDRILTTSWIQHTWSFMSQQQIQLNDNTPTIPLAREGDRIIMDEIASKGNYTNHEIKRINKIRIYLKAFTLSDISTGDGLFITKNAWEGKLEPTDCRYNGCNWPLWKSIDKGDIKLWQQSLSNSFCTRRERKLDQELGCWIQRPKETWQWYLDKNGTSLYRYFQSEWQIFTNLLSTVRHKQFGFISEDLTTSGDPTDIIPTTVLIKHDGIHCEGTSRLAIQSDEPPIVDDYLDWLHFTKESSESIDQLIHDIRQGTAVAVSDGSYKETIQFGTAAWRIESKDSEQFIQGTSISPGPPQLQNAYRSELVGQLAIFEELRQLSKSNSLDTGHVIIACDGINALDVGRYKGIDKISPNSKHCDITSATKKI